MKHYITGYNPGEDEQVFKIRLPLQLTELRAIMLWEDDGECVFDNELTTLQAKAIEQASGIELPDGLDFFLTTESD